MCELLRPILLNLVILYVVMSRMKYEFQRKTTLSIISIYLKMNDTNYGIDMQRFKIINTYIITHIQHNVNKH